MLFFNIILTVYHKEAFVIPSLGEESSPALQRDKLRVPSPPRHPAEGRDPVFCIFPCSAQKGLTYQPQILNLLLQLT